MVIDIFSKNKINIPQSLMCNWQERMRLFI